MQLRPLKQWLAEHRLVWPALLSIGASTTPFVSAWLVEMATTVEDTGVRLDESIFLIYLGVAFLALSIVEFVDWDHRKIWGSIVACLFGLYLLVDLGALYSSRAQLSVADLLQVLAYFSALLAGFLGGLLGAIWKIHQPSDTG